MTHSDLLQALQAGKTPPKLRMLIAQGLAPIPPNEMIELLVILRKDQDDEIAAQASRTIDSWDSLEILNLLKSRDCATSVLEFFASAKTPDRLLEAIIANPSAPDSIIESLALTVPSPLLETILDNRNRIIQSPKILENIRQNPSATSEIQRLALEIETEFLGGKKKEYAVEEPDESAPARISPLELEFEAPLEDLSLEGLPLDSEEREAAILKRLSTMPVRQKIRYALFGNREIRAMLIRDSNREVARAVLQSPKLTENEVEGIASMRSVAEDILREVGSSKEWTKSYSVVQNLVKNPKTPPLISQRLLFRLRSQDLTLMTRDRSLPEAVRHNAARVLKQRTARPSQ
jgi:hypothetical protein